MKFSLKDILLFFVIFIVVVIATLLVINIINNSNNIKRNYKFLEKYASTTFGVKLKIDKVNVTADTPDNTSDLTLIQFQPIDGVTLLADLPLSDIKNKDVSRVTFNISDLKVAKEIQDYINERSTHDNRVTSLTKVNGKYNFTLSTDASSSSTDDTMSMGYLEIGKDPSKMEFVHIYTLLKDEIALETTTDSE